MKRTPLRRKTPLRSVGRKTVREAADVAAFRTAVHARRWCEGNATTCSAHRHEGHHAHHVWPSDRRVGIHDPERGLLLCHEAHRYAHDHPQWSYENGYLGRAS